MASARQAGDVLPRPRIPNVLGMLNIIFATFLMIFSIYVGWYAAIMPISNRAMAEVRARVESDLEAQAAGRPQGDRGGREDGHDRG